MCASYLNAPALAFLGAVTHDGLAFAEGKAFLARLREHVARVDLEPPLAAAGHRKVKQPPVMGERRIAEPVEELLAARYRQQGGRGGPSVVPGPAERTKDREVRPKPWAGQAPVLAPPPASGEGDGRLYARASRRMGAEAGA